MKDTKIELCGCGKPSIYGLWHCEACRKRIQDDYAELLTLCRNSHRKAGGGAAMCICGFGSGGSSACSALKTLIQAMTTKNIKLKNSILEAIGEGYDI